MLREHLEARLTPASRTARKLGYVREAVAIAARHRRYEAAWRTHLRETRRFLSLVSEDARNPRGRVTVLGSGALLDLPLDDLAADFAEVVLVDLVHPRAARRAAGRYANVRLVEADVTGLAEAALACQPLQVPAVAPLPETDADLVISANLLSQLPMMLLSHVAAEEEDALITDILRSHLAGLSRLAARVCLITEIERHWVECDLIEERENPLPGLDLPPPDKTWFWDLAPAPEFHPRRSIRLKVGAYAGLFKK